MQRAEPVDCKDLFERADSLKWVFALHLLFMDVDQSEHRYVVGGASIGVCMCGYQEPFAGIL